jgi:integrase
LQAVDLSIFFLFFVIPDFETFGRQRPKPRRGLAKFVATLLAILFQRIGPKRAPTKIDVVGGMSLYGSSGARKYLNGAERQRFRKAVEGAAPKVRLFCLTLAWGGGRISETLALTPAAIDIETGVTNFETLKRRRCGVVRQVPMPRWLLTELDREFGIRAKQRDPGRAERRLWSWSRTTGWRYVKAIMVRANIHGMPSSPKGLRHTFGVASFQALVPPHLVQRWLGHASLRTTAIYADVAGPEERSFAARMWRSW